MKKQVFYKSSLLLFWSAIAATLFTVGCSVIGSGGVAAGTSILSGLTMVGILISGGLFLSKCSKDGSSSAVATAEVDSKITLTGTLSDATGPLEGYTVTLSGSIAASLSNDIASLSNAISASCSNITDATGRYCLIVDSGKFEHTIIVKDDSGIAYGTLFISISETGVIVDVIVTVKPGETLEAAVINGSTENFWVQDAYLKASNSVASINFGNSVAISGDTIVVGAQNESGDITNATVITNDDNTAPLPQSSNQSGAVYVFKKDGTGDWDQDAYLKASNAKASANFGSAIATDGTTIVVTANNESGDAAIIDNVDGSPTGTSGYYFYGAAYVFKKDSGGNWIQDAYLKSSNSVEYTNFGSSVAVSGNVIAVGDITEKSTATVITNDDGLAPANSGSSNVGAVYVFKKDGSGDWSQDAYLKASNASASHQFGNAVDIDSTGNTIVVGAQNESGDITNATVITNDDNTAPLPQTSSQSGAVYVFKKDGAGDWSQDAYLKASNANANSHFGQVSINGAGDTIVVGAEDESTNASAIINTDALPTGVPSGYAQGAVYVFKKDGSGDWSQDAYLKASNSVPGIRFGSSVEISGSTIIVGADAEAGSAKMIDNVDGLPTGTPSGATQSGAVYVFKKDDSGDWSQDAYLKASNNVASANFGKAIAISGTTIVAGSQNESGNITNFTAITNNDGEAISDQSSSQSGAVYIFSAK